MTVTAASFRTDFPEFASTTTFPDGQVNFWIGLAGKMMATERWGELLDAGTELFIAHNLAIQAKDVKSAASGGAGGTSGGVVASKSVDKVSIAYDTSASTIEGGADLNLTTYGTRYLRLARMVGAGGLQL